MQRIVNLVSSQKDYIAFLAFLLSTVFSVLKGYTCVVAWVVAAVAGGVVTILGIVVGFCQASWGSGEMGDNGARQQVSFLLWVSA